MDTTPPVISAVAPQGIVKSADAALSATVTDEQSDVSNVTIALDGGNAESVAVDGGGVSRNVSGLTPGTHSVTVVATSGGGSSTHTWTFTVELDTTPPVISEVAPQGVIKEASTTISVAVGDEQSDITRVNIDIDGTGGRAASIREGRASRVVSELTPGTHTVTVSAESAGGTCQAYVEIHGRTGYDTARHLGGFPTRHNPRGFGTNFSRNWRRAVGYHERDDFD